MTTRAAPSVKPEQVPEQNPRIDQRREGDKFVITVTMYVELDHMGRPWRMPVKVPR